MTLPVRVPWVGSRTEDDPYRPKHADEVDEFSCDTSTAGEGIEVEFRGPDDVLNDIADKIENERAIEVLENKAGNQS